MTEPFMPVRDESLSDRAYQQIRIAILQMKIKPSEPLVEQKLADALGISKTPIRQALQRLEQTGLVRRIPNRGFFVREFTLEDAREILEIRAVLEGLAVKQACGRLTQDDFTVLELHLDDARTALEENDLEKCAEIGHEFHRVLMDAADNSRLALMIGILNDQFHRIRLLSSKVPGRLPHSVDEHMEILNALRDGDDDRAESAMRRHLIEVYNDIAGDGDLQNRIDELDRVSSAAAY